MLEHVVVGDSEMVVWWGTPVECASAVHRLRREGRFSSQEAALLLERVGAMLEASHSVQPVEGVSVRALRLLARYDLRAADSLQLAAALVWARDQGAGREFICLDTRLREAAAAEGFRVLPDVRVP
jgi:uncharacterized protein